MSDVRYPARNASLKAMAYAVMYKARNSAGLQVGLFCEVCLFRIIGVHAHHDDYAQPLAVRWLCPRCHVAWHRIRREDCV